jgi:exodeoxyribonuclease-3
LQDTDDAEGDRGRRGPIGGGGTRAARRSRAVKIATFNINNVNRRLLNLLAWLESAKPDVACLQELKAEDRVFPEAALRDVGYNAVWHGARAHGTASLSLPVERSRF